MSSNAAIFSSSCPIPQLSSAPWPTDIFRFISAFYLFSLVLSFSSSFIFLATVVCEWHFDLWLSDVQVSAKTFFFEKWRKGFTLCRRNQEKIKYHRMVLTWPLNDWHKKIMKWERRNWGQIFLSMMGFFQSLQRWKHESNKSGQL